MKFVSCDDQLCISLLNYSQSCIIGPDSVQMAGSFGNKEILECWIRITDTVGHPHGSMGLADLSIIN
jgi:hypothetical protein